jgi:hypothetical protein
MITLPKVPKVADLVVALRELEVMVNRNDARITALETDRVDPLELFAAEHKAGAVHRAEELKAVRAQMLRDRWLRTLRR